MEKNKRAATGRDSEKYIVRFPEGMRASIAEAAKANNRSMNAEIVARLEISFAEPDAAKANERRKLELVHSYIEWCEGKGKDPYKSFVEFARIYAEDHDENELERVSSIPTVDPKYLSDLFSIWIVERPQRFPQLADRRVVAELPRFQGSIAEPDPLVIAEIEKRAAEWGCSKTQALIRMTIEEIAAKK